MWSETPKFVYVHVHKHIHSLAHIHKCHEATILSICGLRNCFVTSAETSFFTFVLVYRACYAQWSRCFRWLPIIFLPIGPFNLCFRYGKNNSRNGMWRPALLSQWSCLLSGWTDANWRISYFAFIRLYPIT